MVVLNKVIRTSRTTEVDALSMRIINLYKEENVSEDSHLEKILASLTVQSARLTTAINSDLAKSELEQKDEVRDSKIRAIHYLILGSLHHPALAVTNAAEKVDKVFEKYGLSIIEQSYASETSLTESILEEFAAPELEASIAAISGLEGIIQNLRAAQTSFEQTNTKYEQDKAKQGSKDNASAVKKEVIATINNQLVTYLRAMIQVDEPKYGALTRSMAATISTNNETVKRRIKRNQVE